MPKGDELLIFTINGKLILTEFTDYNAQNLSRIIEMAWEDRTPFEAIQQEFKLNDAALVKLMRQHLNLSSFKLWRKRVAGRKTKHLKLRSLEINRGYCTRQYKHH